MNKYHLHVFPWTWFFIPDISVYRSQNHFAISNQWRCLANSVEKFLITFYIAGVFKGSSYMHLLLSLLKHVCSCPFCFEDQSTGYPQPSLTCGVNVTPWIEGHKKKVSRSFQYLQRTGTEIYFLLRVFICLLRNRKIAIHVLLARQMPQIQKGSNVLVCEKTIYIPICCEIILSLVDVNMTG